MNEKIAVVTRAGRLSGSMIVQKIRRWPAAVDLRGLVQLARDAPHELHHEEDEERLGGQELADDSGT